MRSLSRPAGSRKAWSNTLRSRGKLATPDFARAEDFTQSEAGCLLGKAGRAHFYAEWEALAARLRKLFAKSVGDVASAIVQAGIVWTGLPAAIA